MFERKKMFENFKFLISGPRAGAEQKTRPVPEKAAPSKRFPRQPVSSGTDNVYYGMQAVNVSIYEKIKSRFTREVYPQLEKSVHSTRLQGALDDVIRQEAKRMLENGEVSVNVRGADGRLEQKTINMGNLGKTEGARKLIFDSIVTQIRQRIEDEVKRQRRW